LGSTPGGEAAVAVDSVVALAALCPGAQGVIYDTAFRGVHHQRLMRDLGLLSVNKMTAAKAGAKKPRRDEGRRVPRSTFLEQRTITRPDGSATTVDLFACDGAVGVVRLSDTGEQCFEPLSRARTHRNRDKNGKFRWYNDYRLPAAGGATITIRLHANDDDVRRRFNRTENIRPIPAADPDSPRCTGAATTPNRSTAPSTTPCGYDAPTPSVTTANTSTCSRSRSV